MPFQFRSTEILGHVISKDGISPAEDKVSAITAALAPTTPSETRSFLGIVNFCAKFIPNMATLADPLRRCVKEQESFHWGKEQAVAFRKIKDALSSADILAIFNKQAPTTMIADASPVGLGAVLAQEHAGVLRPVSFASRALTDVERHYSQTEREALALVWACERFSIYLLGRPLTLVTDYKPLEVIYGKRSKPSARIER